MDLFTDYAQPYELSLTARVGQEEAERNRVTLAQFLPNTYVPGTSIKLIQGENGLNEVAEYRAYDSETAFGEAPGGKATTVDLPPLGQQARVSEWDQLQMRNINNQEMLTNSQLKVAKRIGAAIADRVELARGQVIQTGRFTANEGGFITDVDFGRDPEMSAIADTPWSDPETATPISDIQQWVQDYVDANGTEPGAFVLSKAARTALKLSDEVRKYATNGNLAQLVNNDFVDNLLAGENLPPVFEYNRKVKRGNQLINVMDPATAVFVPPAELEAGSTPFGTTLESLEADYSIPPEEQAGIVVGAYKSRNPIGIYIHGAAIVMPVLRNANAFMAVTVL